MDSVPSYNMTVAPVFYGTRVDICWPLKAYFSHKRTTIKIWFVVFYCMRTSTT